MTADPGVLRAGLERYLDTWRRAGIGPATITTTNGHLVVTRRGARVVPFDDRGRPLLWLSAAVLPGADVGAWAASDAWNFGAERLWIGPELRLMVKDRSDFDGSYELSRALDPGDWELTEVDVGSKAVAGSGAADNAPRNRHHHEPEIIRLRQELSLPAYQPSASLGLEVEQRLTLAGDPARRLPSSAELHHLGWTREVTLSRNADDQRTVACQAWVLAQVEAPATVLVPGAGEAVVTDYFEPIDAAHLHRRGADLAMAITARQRFKVGIRTGEHRGLIACWRDLPDGEATLAVRYFFDAPSSRYLEEPPYEPGHEGDSLYVYNDDGRFGDFGEVEALGRALEPAADSVCDVFEFHLWWGNHSALRELANELLGMG